MLGAIQSILVLVLTSYLSVVNSLAYAIESILPAEQTPTEIAEKAAEETDEISTLPSSYERGGLLPDILIKNAAYQKAAVIEGTGNAETASSLTDALVNIYCTFTTDTYVKTTTGTGFFVSDSGVILTNAHVAMFLLLEDIEEAGKSKCVVRTGSPAEPTYLADLLYISPAWINRNAAVISASVPKGTGERDYALLYVTSTLDSTPTPAHFPFLSVNSDLVSQSLTDATVTIGGYPASKTAAGLSVTQATSSTSIAEIYTFGTKYGDLLALRGSPVGEHGISGGPVLNEDNEAIGLISTKGDQEELGTGSLNAITLSYINRTLIEETGFGFASSIAGDLHFRAQIFRETLRPFLGQILSDEI